MSTLNNYFFKPYKFILFLIHERSQKKTKRIYDCARQIKRTDNVTSIEHKRTDIFNNRPEFLNSFHQTFKHTECSTLNQINSISIDDAI